MAQQVQTLDKEWLRHEYIDLGKNRYEISEETGVSPVRIGTLLQKYQIKRYSIKRHGLSSHKLNAVWNGIKERCNNPNADNYKWYGGKGVTVCDEWATFESFFQWAIDNGWEPGLTVDRKDGDKGYSPDNCRIVSLKQQCRNRSSNVIICVDGESHLQCEWEEILGWRRKIIAKWKCRHGMDYVIARIREAMSE